MFEAAVKELNLDIWLKNDQKAQTYYSYLVEMGDRQFIWPERVRRGRDAPGVPPEALALTWAR